MKSKNQDLFFSGSQTRSRKLSKPYSDCTETGDDIPVENLYNKSYSLQVILLHLFYQSLESYLHKKLYSTVSFRIRYGEQSGLLTTAVKYRSAS